MEKKICRYCEDEATRVMYDDGYLCDKSQCFLEFVHSLTMLDKEVDDDINT